MNSRSFSATALTGIDAALSALLDGLVPVEPGVLPLDQALGRVAAATLPLESALPPYAVAVTDGWACRALDLVGASAYSPVALAAAPVWVEAGDAMPDGCDCILQADLVDCGSSIAQAVGEAVPGHGVRHAGEDMTAGRPLALEGRTLSATDLLVARKAGHDELAVRSPRVGLIDAASASGDRFTSLFLADSLAASGATVRIESVQRDAASISAALDGEASDLIVVIGGTGEGRTDATVEAFARRKALIAHRLALRPGGTTATGRLGRTPVIALPGLPDHAFAGFLALVVPVLDRLTGRNGRRSIVLPLSRKVSSAVGLSEIVLLAEEEGAWTPLAVGDFSLDAIRLADAWLAVPRDSEGYAVGTSIAANPLRYPD